MQGLLTIAVKNPYYGRMSFNLAASIRAADPDFPIAVIADARGLAHLSDQQIDIFTNIIPVDDCEHGVSHKVELYELSPFEETIFIDSDSVWITKRSPRDLIESLPKDCFFTAITEGKYNFETRASDVSKKYTFWAELADIEREYEITRGTIYQFRSEVMFFRRDERTKIFFDTAREIYLNPPTKFLKFVKGVPDELAFNIAALKLDIHPHVFRWQPSFWTGLHGLRIPQVTQLSEQGFFSVSCGGSSVNSVMKNFYNRLVKFSMNKIGRQHIFELMPKHVFIKDRKKQ